MTADQRRALRIVVPRYGASVIGGSEALARRIATALVRRGWDIEVFTTTASDERTWKATSQPEGDRDGVSVRRFPTAIRRHPALFHQLTRGFFRLPPAVRPEALWFAAQGPYAPRLVTALASAPRRPALFIPYLYHPTIRGLPRAARPRILIPAAHDEPALRLRSVARALSAADALWYSTPEERALVESAHPSAARTARAVGTVGVEAPARPDPERFRRRHAVSGRYLLYGGRMTDGKGVEDLLAGLRAVRERHPEVQLVLTGEARPPAAPDSGVRSVGRLDEGTHWDAIAGAAMIVVPSRFESLSLLALEAWAAGRPCLLNAASPVLAAQALRSGGALTFRGPAELAASASRLLTDPAQARALGEAGRRYIAAAHGWDQVVERLEGLIDEGQHGMPR